MRHVYIAAARRSAVAPRNGAFRSMEVSGLAAPVLRTLLHDAGIDFRSVGHVVLGNALYGGGNPARVCALAAGLPDIVPAMTIDTQCCAGLDAVIVGASLIASGQAEVVIAGGVESYSRAPLRARRPRAADEQPEPYLRPPFTPWPDADPDMIEAAAALAADLGVSRQEQERFAIASHVCALDARERLAREIVSVEGQAQDAFTRVLTEHTCARLPLVAGTAETGLTGATTAVEADAACALLLVSESALGRCKMNHAPARYVAGRSGGGDPQMPGLAPIAVAKSLLEEARLATNQLAAVEIMEAFAVQAMAFVDALGLAADQINKGGGALARGHPIGASGAILATRLFHELQGAPDGTAGLAAIAAAGGLGSAVLLTRP